MDVSTAIIGLVLLGIFVVPIAVLNAGSKKKALIAELKEWAAQNECEIADCDTGEQFAIGISNNKEQVFFIRKEAEDYTYFKSNIPVKSISDCVLHKTSVDKQAQQNTNTGIAKLEIRIRHTSSKSRPTSWLLFDASKSAKANQELELGTKWVSIIKEAM